MALMSKTCRNPLLALAMLSAIAVLALSGCESTQPEEGREGGRARASGLGPEPVDMSYAWQGFPQPCPTPQDAKILIEKFVPQRVKPNQTFSFKITVSNNATYPIDSMDISETLPKDFVLTKAAPTPEKKGDNLVWTFKSVNPGQKRNINVTGKITKPGAGMYFGDTDLNFETGGALSSVVNVIQPVLDFKIDAPKVVIVNEVFPTQLMFRNSGEAPVIDTRLVHTLPRGLLTAEGKSKIEIDVGDLAPGKSKEVPLQMKAEIVQTYTVPFVATAEGGVTATATMKTEATTPKLTVAGMAPKKRYVGNIIPYTITVKNAGNAIAKNTTVDLSLPDGVSLASANEEGKARGNAVIWQFKTLNPGESKRLEAKVVAKKIMVARAVAVAKTFGTEPVQTVMFTDVAGIAAVLGELEDINDPVPLGENEIYEITVMNQGSLPATKIQVTCFLKQGYMEFVKSSGATKSSVKDNVVTFEPLPALQPQAQAKWRVIVKALKEGDVRFTIQINSDQLTRPVERSEATHFYK